MDPLADPCNDRVLKETVPPPHLPLDRNLLYTKTGRKSSLASN